MKQKQQSLFKTQTVKQTNSKWNSYRGGFNSIGGSVVVTRVPDGTTEAEKLRIIKAAELIAKQK